MQLARLARNEPSRESISQEGLLAFLLLEEVDLVLLSEGFLVVEEESGLLASFAALAPCL